MAINAILNEIKEMGDVTNYVDSEAIKKADFFFLILNWLHVPAFTLFIYFQNNLHWHALISTTLLSVIYTLSYMFSKGTFLHRVLSGIILMTFSSILINLTLGQIEQHFHILIFLPALIAYKDWRVLIPAALWTASHHLIFTYCQVQNIELSFWPIKIFKFEQSWEIAFIHIAYVVVEVILLTYFCEVLRRDSKKQNELINNLEDIVEKRNLQLLKRNNELTVTMNKIKRMQKVIVANEKLASLGQLSAGVAHEIKNPLHIINSSKEIIEDFFEDYDTEKIKAIFKKNDENEMQYFDDDCNDIKEASKMITEGATRIDNVVKTMLSNARESEEELVEIDLNELITNNLTLVYKSFTSKSGIQVENIVNLDGIPPLKVRQSEVARVFINLFENSMYSLSKKYQENENFSPQIKVTFEQTNNELIISVRDNGVGIAQKHIEKVLEPFFTTKPTNEGTGLGMSMVVDIIQSHGGLVEIDSEVNEYVNIKLIFPNS